MFTETDNKSELPTITFRNKEWKEEEMRVLY